jgi:outer membrane receptor protein involved in Fe transport
MRWSVLGTIVSLSLVGLCAADEVDASIRHFTNIPAQDLAPALRTLAKERNFQIVFASQDVQTRRTPGAVGELTTAEALERLLIGSGLRYEYLDDKTITIVPIAMSPPHKDSAEYEAPPATAPQAATAPASGAAHDSNNVFRQRVRVAQAEQSAGASNASAGNETAVEEIVVTAQKREQSIRDVPLSITAISAGEIDRRRMVGAEDYLRGIPGANQVGSANGPSIVIRGVETSPQIQNFGSGATTATYFGETPTTNSAGLSAGTNIDIKLVDIQRVEVLRGPQGTAFGNSSMGGAVRTIPMPASPGQLEAKATVSYSATSGSGGRNYDGTLVGNIPLIQDKLAIRVVGYEFNDSGFYRNRAGSDPAFQAGVVVPYGVQAFSRNDDEVGDYEVRGGRIAALYQPVEAFKLTLSYLRQKSWTDGMPVASSSDYEQDMLDVDPAHVVRGKEQGVSDTDVEIANLTGEYDLGSGSLVATYSHTRSSTVVAQPFQLYGQGWPMSFFAPSRHRENVGEVRYVSRLDGPLNFLAGIYAEKLTDRTINSFLWFADPALNFFDPGNPLVGNYLDHRELRQKAAFGELSYELTPALTLTGGARAYHYKRHVGTDTTGIFFGDTASDDTGKASGSTFRGNLSYQPNKAALIYLGWAQGFRLGKPQPGLPPGRCDLDGDGIVDGTQISVASTKDVNSDDVDSYEIGGKFALLDNRLTIDTAIFRLDWSDIPVTVHAGVQPASCGLTYVTNAGSARSEGIELQARYQLSQRVRIDFGGSRIRAKLTEDVPAQGFSTGDRLPGSPKVNANLGIEYGFSVGDYPLSIRADSIYVGSFYGDILATPNLEAGDYVKVDASARLSLRNLNIDLFVRNLTNEDAFTFRDTTPSVGEFFGYQLRPRTIGVQFGYTFQ